MEENTNFTSVEKFLDGKDIQHNPILIKSIKKYLNSKISGEGLTHSLKDGDEYFTLYLDTPHVKKKITKLIEDNQALAKKYTL